MDVSSLGYKAETRYLIPHERIQQERVDALKKRMKRDDKQKRPIIVFRIGNKLLILDGHHRAAALEDLGYPSVYVMEIGFYLSNFIMVDSWNRDKVHDKTEIIQRALAGKLYESKDTRHWVRLNEDGWETFHKHEKLAPEVNIHLRKLKHPEIMPPPPMRLI
ncbi:MAG: ParB N-terminal domain-containing protein [Candidatus Micrarchaeales archaeon]